MRFNSIAFLAGVTPIVGGGGSFSASYVTHAINQTEFENPKVFTGLSVGTAAADRKVYIYFFARGPRTTDTITLSINGGTAFAPLASEMTDGNRLVFVFAADIPTGTSVDLSFNSSGNDFKNCGVASIRVVGSHTALTSSSTIFGTTNGAINTNAGDTIFSGVMYGGDFAAGFFGVPSGFTEHFDEPTRPSIPAQPATLRSGIASGGTPESFPGTVADTGGTSEVVLRLRAT